MLIYLFKT